jgi:hypothetical protein
MLRMEPRGRNKPACTHVCGFGRHARGNSSSTGARLDLLATDPVVAARRVPSCSPRPPDAGAVTERTTMKTKLGRLLTQAVWMLALTACSKDDDGGGDDDAVAETSTGGSTSGGTGGDDGETGDDGDTLSIDPTLASAGQTSNDPSAGEAGTLLTTYGGSDSDSSGDGGDIGVVTTGEGSSSSGSSSSSGG